MRQMHSAMIGSRFDIAAFGEIVSDPSRVAMLLSLMDGQARPASELARVAGVTPPTASAHLGRLLQGGFVLAEPRGRHRYFRLAGDRVADALEAIALGAAPRKRHVPSEPSRAVLARARTCYKHLAGALGVAWLAALERKRCLRVGGGAMTLAPRGVARFEEIGLTAGDWPPGKPCLDWTERKNHLGGPLGVLLTQHLFALGWLRRREEGRALRITSKGRSGFARFGLADSILDAGS
jgi:DNA-binding transcriptional ArsR family regulator